jgi:hypothetical protein
MVLPANLFAGCLKMLKGQKMRIGLVQSVTVAPGLSEGALRDCAHKKSQFSTGFFHLRLTQHKKRAERRLKCKFMT